MKRALILLALCVWTVNLSLASYGDDSLDADATFDNCTTEGVQCNCANETAIYFCSAENSEPEIIGMCSGEKQYCMQDAPGGEMCTENRNPDCIDEANVQFDCTSDGMFPSPIHMNTYYICVNEEGTEAVKKQAVLKKCPDDYCYDPMSTFCSVPKSKCQRKPPTLVCSTFHGPTKLAWHPSMYYMCVIDSPVSTTTKPNRDEEYSDVRVTYHPELFKCPHGEVWNKTCGGN